MDLMITFLALIQHGVTLISGIIKQCYTLVIGVWPLISYDMPPEYEQWLQALVNFAVVYIMPLVGNSHVCIHCWCLFVVNMFVVLFLFYLWFIQMKCGFGQKNNLYTVLSLVTMSCIVWLLFFALLYLYVFLFLSGIDYKILRDEVSLEADIVVLIDYLTLLLYPDTFDDDLVEELVALFPDGEWEAKFNSIINTYRAMPIRYRITEAHISKLIELAELIKKAK